MDLLSGGSIVFALLGTMSCVSQLGLTRAPRLANTPQVARSTLLRALARTAAMTAMLVGMVDVMVLGSTLLPVIGWVALWLGTGMLLLMMRDRSKPTIMLSLQLVIMSAVSMSMLAGHGSGTPAETLHHTATPALLAGSLVACLAYVVVAARLSVRPGQPRRQRVEFASGAATIALMATMAIAMA